MPETPAIGDLIAMVKARTTKELLQIMEEMNDELNERVYPDDDENVTARGGIRPTTVGNPL